MKIKKGFALLISLALMIGTVLPGTLALSADEASGSGTIEVSEEAPAPAPDAEEAPASEETVAPASEETAAPASEETAAPDETPTVEPDQTCTCDPAPAEGEAHQEGCPLYTAPKQPAEEEKACTCDPAPAEGEAHQEGCPLYTVPKQPAEEEKTCTCDPAPAEGEAHQEGCPFYTAPEQPAASAHIDTCSDDCTDAECKCPCHLFDRLMACTTLEELEAVIKATPEDELKSLSEEQVAKVEAHMDELMPEPLPPIVIEESEPPVESEIYRPTVNYTNVAPFGEPVTGGHR